MGCGAPGVRRRVVSGCLVIYEDAQVEGQRDSNGLELVRKALAAVFAAAMMITV